MPDYQNGKIYKLVSDETDKIYIGSTCTLLCKRLWQHQNSYKQWKIDSSNDCITSFQLFQLGDVDIILIENYPCGDKNELHARERYWIEQNKEIIVNKVFPNKLFELGKVEYNKQYSRKYREENKEALSIIKKQYNKVNSKLISQKRDKLLSCECGGTNTNRHFTRHLKSLKHQSYLKEKENRIYKISQLSFDFIFECDSKMLLPKSYTNISIV